MLNQVQVIGHLGGDPDTKFTAGGDAVTNFSVAASEKWTDKSTGERKEATEWFRCVAFGKLAEICGEYLKKGQLVYCSGKLRTNKYTDKEGIERYSTQVILDTMRMLGGKKDGDSGERNERQPSQTQRPAGSSKPNNTFEDEEVPF